MSDKTGIEWTEATWNPVTGCAKVSQGCKHCYAEREWPRMTRLVKAYAGRAFTDVRTHGDRLDQPIRWTKPRMIFVNSMSDLFHEAVPDDFIDSVFGVMWACLWGRNEKPGHVFQVLTKRADRMRDYLLQDRREQWARAAVNHGGGIDPDGIWDQVMDAEGPHPRIWLGVSVEDQKAADERIPLLLQTPAAVRWISAEPLLGPVDIHHRLGSCVFTEADPLATGRGIDWVVVGGESGPKARPMQPEWARTLRDQCEAAGVAFLFKQWGEWGPNWFNDDAGQKIDGSEWMDRMGKKAAGRLLDGRQHDGYPGDEA
jgi:protein gp37